ncbi:MAG: hypothetical protein R3F02_18810 [Thiolinea sp.]
MGFAVGGVKIDNSHAVAIGGVKIAGMAVGNQIVYQRHTTPQSWTFSVNSFASGFDAHLGTQSISSGQLSSTDTTNVYQSSGSTASEYITADFGSVVLLSNAYLRDSGSLQSKVAHVIEASVDGITWFNQQDVAVNAGLQTFAFNTDARYVRVRSSGTVAIQISQFYFD